MSDGTFTGWISVLARCHTHRLTSVARSEGLSRDDALDAVQEGFHTFLGLPHARSLAGNDEESARLLAVVVRNAARNLRRRHHRVLPHQTLDDVNLADPHVGVEDLVARAEEHVRLLGCIHSLASIQRHVVTLRMLQEVSAREVAELLGLTPGHVAVLLHRAKKNLEQCLLG